MSRTIFSVGVDLGGTWVRVEAVDAQSRSLRSLRAAAPAIQGLPALLKKCFRSWNAKPERLTVASRGIWSQAERSHLAGTLRGLASRVSVISDVEAAWFAAFDPQAPGIIVIAGTGSIAYGRDSQGRKVRSGGWGPLLGDEGSAFWIGRTWLKQTHGDDKVHRILKLIRHSHEAVRRVAALTPGILKRAKAGDRVARNIIRQGQDQLAELVADTDNRLRIKHPVPVSWGGTLLNNEYFRQGMLAALRRKSARTFRLIAPKREPAAAVARLF